MHSVFTLDEFISFIPFSCASDTLLVPLGIARVSEHCLRLNHRRREEAHQDGQGMDVEPRGGRGVGGQKCRCSADGMTWRLTDRLRVRVGMVTKVRQRMNQAYSNGPESRCLEIHTSKGLAFIWPLALHEPSTVSRHEVCPSHLLPEGDEEADL